MAICQRFCISPTQDRGGEEGEEQWVLSRFYPLLQDVLEDVIAGRLSDEEYPYVRHPPPATSQSEHFAEADLLIAQQRCPAQQSGD